MRLGVTTQDISRVLQEQKRVNVDFPSWMIASLDREAGRLGVTRQSIILVDELGLRLEAAAERAPDGGARQQAAAQAANDQCTRQHE